MTVPAHGTRGRGRPARVSRDSIIEAARSIPPVDLSMQSVADRLGVDRSTINYHFSDREDLFTAVAAFAFGNEMSGFVAPPVGDWRQWVATYARAVHSALRRHPEFAGYVRLASGADAAAFAPIEGLITALTHAGFSERNMAQSVAYVSEVVHAAARNEILVTSGRHPQGAELDRFFDGQSDDAVPGLRRLVELDPYDHENHFEFAVTMLVAGLETLLPT